MIVVIRKKVSRVIDQVLIEMKMIRILMNMMMKVMKKNKNRKRIQNLIQMRMKMTTRVKANQNILSHRKSLNSLNNHNNHNNLINHKRIVIIIKLIN